MKQPVVVQYDEMMVISLPLGSVALDTGDFIDFDTNACILMNADSEDNQFVGISGGKRKNTGDMIPVYTRCIIEVDCTSASYALGAGLKYTSKNTVVADSNANTIGWSAYNYTSSVTRIRMYINVAVLGAAADKLFDTVSA